MRKLVIGDIHGGLKALNQVLDKAQLTNEDTLIFLGDYVDGWSESAQVITYLMELEKNYTCIFIKGNHDQYCENWMKTNLEFGPWMSQGGEATVASYKNISEHEKQAHLNFIERMKLYYIDEANNLFIHAGYTSMHGPQKEQHPANYYWDRTLWETAVAMDKQLDKNHILYPKRFLLFNQIFIGHTPTTNYNMDMPLNCANIWNIDTGAGFKGKLSVLDIANKEFWQSDYLPNLYPNEKGRN